MGRDTSGVRGMNVSQKGNALLAMDVAADEQELLVVTENGYGKRTPISEYPVKGRGTMGVKTITLTENKGALAGALVVREHQELVFISQAGMVQRTSVRGINRYGRSSQGVKVMNIREDDQVSAIALVVESETDTAAPVIDGAPGAGPVDLASDDLAGDDLTDDGISGDEPADDDLADQGPEMESSSESLAGRRVRRPARCRRPRACWRGGVRLPRPCVRPERTRGAVDAGAPRPMHVLTCRVGPVKGRRD